MPCGGCILVVDDDPDIRDALTECFEALGCTVVGAVDGLHAVERLETSPRPCLALLDLDMPRLDGAGLAAFIRTHKCHCGLPIISMSAGTARLEPPLVECHHAKPFDFSVMTPLVEKLCREPEWLRATLAAARARPAPRPSR